MPLRKQPAQIPLRGLDTHSDPKSAAPGTCDLIENLWFKRAALGGLELRKRFGVTARTRNIFGGGTLSAGKALEAYVDEQLLFTGTDSYSWFPQSSTWQVGNKRHMATIKSQFLGIHGNGSDAYSADVAIGGGYICVVEGRDGGNVLIMEAATGHRVAQLSNLTSGLGKRVIALSTKFAIFTWDPESGGAGNLRVRTVDYATPTTLSGSTTLLTDLHVGPPHKRRVDIRLDSLNDTCLVAYNKAGGSLQTQVVNANMTLGPSANDADIPDQCIGWVDSDANAGSYYLAYVGAVSGAKIITVASNAALSAKTVVDAAVVTARNVTGYRQGGVNVVLIEVLGSPRYNTKILRWPGSGTTASDWQLSCGLGGKAFRVGTTKAFVWAAYESSPQSCFFLLDATATAPTFAARYAYGFGPGLSGAQSLLPGTVNLSGNLYITPLGRLGNLPAYNSTATPLKTVSLVTLDFDPSDLGHGRQVGESLILPGAQPVKYDGRTFGAMDTPVYPEAPTLGTGAGAMTGTYKVKVVSVSVDAKGDVYRSAPSPEATITLAAQGFTVTPVTSGLASASEFYITKADEDVFYLFSTSGSGTFSLTDTQIGAGQFLYAQDGVLPHIPFPPFRFIETWRGRGFYAGTDAPGGCELWVGNERVSGEAPSVSDTLVIPLETDGGPITALAEDDDRLLIFKEAAIYSLTGGGPADNGDGQFEQPARIFSGVGASGPAAVFKTPFGVMFKGALGLFLLPRGALVPIRMKAVEAYDSLTITGAVIMEDIEQVRFTTSAGTTLVYHYGLVDEQGVGVWTTFTGQAAVDCAIFGGKFCYLASDGTLQVEGTGYSDNSSSITSKLRTCWLALAGLFGRLYTYELEFLGDIMASFTISLALACDYDATVLETDTKAVTAATIAPLALAPKRGMMTAAQLTLQESSTTEGFRVSALGLEIGTRSGAAKLPGGKYLT